MAPTVMCCLGKLSPPLGQVIVMELMCIQFVDNSCSQSCIRGGWWGVTKIRLHFDYCIEYTSVVILESEHPDEQRQRNRMTPSLTWQRYRIPASNEYTIFCTQVCLLIYNTFKNNLYLHIHLLDLEAMF
jgi:hypothetical protein